MERWIVTAKILTEALLTLGTSSLTTGIPSWRKLQRNPKTVRRLKPRPCIAGIQRKPERKLDCSPGAGSTRDDLQSRFAAKSRDYKPTSVIRSLLQVKDGKTIRLTVEE
jgi:hypothetical protein